MSSQYDSEVEEWAQRVGGSFWISFHSKWSWEIYVSEFNWTWDLVQFDNRERALESSG